MTNEIEVSTQGAECAFCERSQTMIALPAALAKAQMMIRAAAKDGKNPHFGSKYATLDAVWTACREPLTANGLSVVQLPRSEDGKVGITTILLHASGEYISQTVAVAPGKADAQAMGSVLTYLRRYALSAMVGITADDDDDGNAASAPTTATRAKFEPAKAAGGEKTYITLADENELSTLCDKHGLSSEFLAVCKVKYISRLEAHRFDGAKSWIEKRISTLTKETK